MKTIFVMFYSICSIIYINAQTEEEYKIKFETLEELLSYDVSNDMQNKLTDEKFFGKQKFTLKGIEYIIQYIPNTEDEIISDLIIYRYLKGEKIIIYKLKNTIDTTVAEDFNYISTWSQINENNIEIYSIYYCRVDHPESDFYKKITLSFIDEYKIEEVKFEYYEEVKPWTLEQLTKKERKEANKDIKSILKITNKSQKNNTYEFRYKTLKGMINKYLYINTTILHLEINKGI